MVLFLLKTQRFVQRYINSNRPQNNMKIFLQATVCIFEYTCNMIFCFTLLGEIRSKDK